MQKFFKMQRWSGRQEDRQIFDRQSFDECRFDACVFTHCRWTHCKFFRVSFHDARFDNCHFERCRFWGQHSYLGPASYEGCIFQDCTFENVQPWDVTFLRCRFPRTALRGIEFYGRHCGRLFGPTVFQDTDLSETELSFIGFSLGVDLSSVRLPRVGVRVFRNPNDELVIALQGASGADGQIQDPRKRLEKCPRRALYVLASGTKQDPLVFDCEFLTSILSNPSERQLFETIAGPFERDLSVFVRPL